MYNIVDMTIYGELVTAFSSGDCRNITAYNNLLYCYVSSYGLVSINPSTGQVTLIQAYNTPPFSETIFGSDMAIFNICIYNDIVYTVVGTKLYKYSLTSSTLTTQNISISANDSTKTALIPPYLYFYDSWDPANGLLRIDINTTTASTVNVAFMQSEQITTTDRALPSLEKIPYGFISNLFAYAGDLYVCYTTRETTVSYDGFYAPSICKVVTSTKTVSYTLFNADDVVNTYMFGSDASNGYVYIASMNLNKVTRFKLTNTSVYDNPYAIPKNVTTTGTNAGTYNTIQWVYDGVVLNGYLYMAQSSDPSTEGINALSTVTKVVLTTPAQPPSDTVSLNQSNTMVVASGNLRVSIFDPTNTLAGGVYYEYALNGGGYINSNVFAGTSPNTFYVLSADISNTIIIRANNAAGNSTPFSIPSNYSIIYQTPRAPPTPSFSLVGSGNVMVVIKESPSPNYYYLNNVSYYLYAYNTFDGTNLSGNTSLLVYNKPIGILSNTNSTYGNVVSYINTGLSANTYTMYVIARNAVGNSSPVYANITVYTTPLAPTIDGGNTKSTTSGNLTITINDTVNTSLNGIYYLYSTDGITYGNSRVFRGANIKTVFTISDTGNSKIPLTANTYTLYVAAANSVGNSTTSVSPVYVYTTPFYPSIDITYTKCETSGNLTIRFTDDVNTSVNSIEYLYYIYDSSQPQIIYF